MEGVKAIQEGREVLQSIPLPTFTTHRINDIPRLNTFSSTRIIDIDMSSADDIYEAQNDVTAGDVPGGDSKDNDYASRTGQSHIPVQKDDAIVEDPIDPATADSDETLRTYSKCSTTTPLFNVYLEDSAYLLD